MSVNLVDLCQFVVMNVEIILIYPPKCHVMSLHKTENKVNNVYTHDFNFDKIKVLHCEQNDYKKSVAEEIYLFFIYLEYM